MKNYLTQATWLNLVSDLVELSYAAAAKIPLLNKRVVDFVAEVKRLTLITNKDNQITTLVNIMRFNYMCMCM